VLGLDVFNHRIEGLGQFIRNGHGVVNTMPSTIDEVRTAKVALISTMGDPDWLRGVGIGRDLQGYYIRVNVASAEGVSAAVPSTWGGVRVHVEVIGDITAR